MGRPMLKIRRSRDCLIFNMGIPILLRRHLYIETPPDRRGAGLQRLPASRNEALWDVLLNTAYFHNTKFCVSFIHVARPVATGASVLILWRFASFEIVCQHPMAQASKISAALAENLELQICVAFSNSHAMEIPSPLYKIGMESRTSP